MAARGFGATYGAGTTDGFALADLPGVTGRTLAGWLWQNGTGGGAAGRVLNANSVSDRWNANDASTMAVNTSWTSGAHNVTYPNGGTGAWHHHAVTITATTIQAYVDGSSVTTTVSSNTASGSLTTWASFSAGNRTSDGARNWDGMLAQIAVWDRVLSADEIAALAKGFSPHHFPGSLVLYLPMDRAGTNFARNQAAPTITGTLVREESPKIILPVGLFLPPNGGAAPPSGELASVTVNDGLALVAGGAAHRVDFVGTSTTWNSGTPTITVDHGTLGAITVDSDTTAHANYTPHATYTGTVTFTDVTDGNTTDTLTVVAAATGYTISPASDTGTTGVASGNWTVALAPSGSASETAITITPSISPDGSVSGTVALDARVVDDSGTFTVTPTADGAHTISISDGAAGLDDSDTSTYTSSTAPGLHTDPNLTWSPGNWYDDGDRMISQHIGAWVEFATTDADVSVEIDYTEHIAASHSTDSALTIGWSRDDRAIQTANTFSLSYSSGLAKIALGSGLSGTSRFRVWVNNLDATIDRWTTPVQALRITRFCRADGSDLSNTSAYPRTRTKRALWYGSSSLEISPTENFAESVSRALDAYCGQVGFRGQSWQATAGGNVPRFYVSGNDAASAWNKQYDGVARDFTALDYVFCFMGTNDDLAAVAAATIQAAVEAWLPEIRAEVGADCWIFLVVPPQGRYRDAFPDAITAAGDSRMAAIDFGTDLQASFPAAGTPTTQYTSDGIHPTVGGLGQMAGLIAAQAQAAITPAGSGGSRRRPQ